MRSQDPVRKMASKIHSKTYIALTIIVLSFFTVLVSGFYKNNSEVIQDQKLIVLEEKVIDEVKTPPKKSTVLVFGDVMLDRYIRNYINTSSTAALFQYVQDDITRADATVVNLEGPITDYESVVSIENLQFTFAAHTARDLARIGVDIVSLANNHTNNFGKKGLEQTRRYLDDAGIVYFGDPYNKTTDHVMRHEVGSTTISFVGYHQFENPELENTLDVIRKEKEAGNFVIFFPHWGNEYEKEAAVSQITKAEKVIDAGADIVIGAHPHVIQNAEMVKDKPVFYSLGNFIFDQWFSEDVKYGLALLLTLSENNLESIELKPFYRLRYEPKWLIDEVRTNWCKKYIDGSLFQTDQNDLCIIRLR